jgi:hypothetical protein
MTNALKSYISDYTQLEAGVKELVLKKCAKLCSECTAICCDKVMCEEAIKSPFLRLIHQQADQFDAENGFLTPKGCSLQKGRPSVCYEYFCDNHFYYQPSDLHAEILQILGSLLFHATRNAKGTIPLDEIPEQELDAIDFETLTKQLAESTRALKIIRQFFDTGNLSDTDHGFLKTIHIPEEFDTDPEASIHSLQLSGISTNKL